MYSHAMKSAKGAKEGTTDMITENEMMKFSVPERAARPEACSAWSTVLMSDVKRFRMRPMGVTSKKRAGARDSRCNIRMNREREACRLA